MKISYSLGLLLLIYTSFCYSDTYIIDEKYTGAPFVKDGDMSGCGFNYDYWQDLTNEERKLEAERCSLNTTKFNFNKLYDLIDKKTVIYRDGDFELIMDRKHQESDKKDKIIYDYDNPIHDIVYEIDLSLVYKKEIKSRISLASYSYNSDRAFYLNSQYYYFDASGDIYIISFKEYGENIKDINNIHYKIDKDNLKFIKL